MRWVEYEREELYRRVWERPMSEIALEEEISDRGLAKICKKMDIPCPPRGYWARVAAGQKPKKVPLPKLKAGVPTVHRRRVDDRLKTEMSEGATELMDEAKDETAVEVSESLENPHELLKKSMKALSVKAPRSLREVARLDINVHSPEVRDRALRVMDALLKTLDARGIEVEITEPVPGSPNPWDREPAKPSRTQVQLLGVSVAFGIDEQYNSILTFHQTEFGKRLGMEPTRQYHREYNGTLALEIRKNGYLPTGARTMWADGKKQRIEDCLDSFIKGLVLVAEGIRQHEERHERRRQKEIADKLAADERRQRAAHEQVLLKDLDERLAAMKKAAEVREFLMQLEARQESACVEPEWIRWAQDLVERLEKQAFEKVFPSTTFELKKPGGWVGN